MKIQNFSKKNYCSGRLETNDLEGYAQIARISVQDFSSDTTMKNQYFVGKLLNQSSYRQMKVTIKINRCTIFTIKKNA